MHKRIRITRIPPLSQLSMQDRYHGQPHGMFAGDECFGGRALNRGIELCAVVRPH